EAYGPADPTWREVQEVLHEELGRLSERYRTPLTLCYLQGRSLADAAVVLGLAVSTLKVRLERGRAILRARLVRRGLGPAAVVLAAAWPAAAPAGLPVGLADATTNAALSLGTVPAAAGMVSAKIIALAEGVQHALLIARWKVTAVVLVVAAVA